MDRVILHCDLNCFFASVELLGHPELQHLPVAVCGDPDSRHGIILAKNEPAKAFGIQTAETIWQARKKCPELLLLPPHHREYSRISRARPASSRENWLGAAMGRCRQMSRNWGSRRVSCKVRQTMAFFRSSMAT